MATEMAPKPQPEFSQPLRFSRDAAQIISNALVLLPQSDTLEPADLVNSVFANEGTLGSLAVVSVLQKSGIDTAEMIRRITQKAAKVDTTMQDAGVVQVNSTEVRASHSLISLLLEAQAQAKGNPIDTGYIVAADLDSSGSVIRTVLSEMGVNETTVAQTVSVFTRELRKNPLRQEKFAKETITISTSGEIAGKYVDLLAKAKEGAFAARVVKRDWLVDSVVSLSNNALTVIATDYDGEARLLSEALAHQLSLDRVMFPYASMVAPDAMELADDTSAVLTLALQKAQGGVLLLPSTSYLDNRQVKSALLSGKVKVLVCASQSEGKAFTAGKQPDYTADVLYLKPPTEKEAVSMFLPIKSVWEQRYSSNQLSITISDEAVSEAVKVGMRYLSTLGGPIQSAVERLMARAVIELQLANSQLTALADARVEKDRQIDVSDIRIAFDKITGMQVVVEDMSRYATMEVELEKSVKGQSEALKAVSMVIKKAKAGFSDRKRPVGSFLFIGPSGVGKTELSETLNRFLYGTEGDMIVFDMSTFKESHMATRLIGAPRGYQDSQDGGELTERVKRKPNAVIVFDEFEKAHRDVADMILGLLEKGTLSDARGEIVDFRNTVIILTGNIGSRRFDQVKQLGFKTVKEQVIADAKATFRPEFFNRLDEVIVFRTLEKRDLLDIVDLQVGRFNQILAETGRMVVVSDAAREYLTVDALASPEYGARPVKRSVEQLKNQLSNWILQEGVGSGVRIQVDFVSGEYIFKKSK